MEVLKLEATQYTPQITLDPNGTISMSGKSYPENTFEFYAPVVKWLEEYFDGSPAIKTTVNMEIIYFNSSSSKLFFDDNGQRKTKLRQPNRWRNAPNHRFHEKWKKE